MILVRSQRMIAEYSPLAKGLKVELSYYRENLTTDAFDKLISSLNEGDPYLLGNELGMIFENHPDLENLYDTLIQTGISKEDLDHIKNNTKTVSIHTIKPICDLMGINVKLLGFKESEKRIS